MTDSKAVTGSKSESGSMFASPSSSVVVIVTGVACGIVFTVLVVFLLVTCRKRVKINKRNQNSGKTMTMQRQKEWRAAFFGDTVLLVPKKNCQNCQKNRQNC